MFYKKNLFFFLLFTAFSSDLMWFKYFSSTWDWLPPFSSICAIELLREVCDVIVCDWWFHRCKLKQTSRGGNDGVTKKLTAFPYREISWLCAPPNRSTNSNESDTESEKRIKQKNSLRDDTMSYFWTSSSFYFQNKATSRTNLDLLFTFTKCYGDVYTQSSSFSFSSWIWRRRFGLMFTYNKRLVKY